MKKIAKYVAAFAMFCACALIGWATFRQAVNLAIEHPACCCAVTPTEEDSQK